MAILKSAKLTQRDAMGQRSHQRFYIGIPMTYQIQVPASPENPWRGSGVLQDISSIGLYFRSNDPPPLEEGQIRDFTFTSTKEHPTSPETDFVIAKGRVVRIEPPEASQPDTGVGIEFVSIKFITYLRRKSI
jgi:hypothetical protein